MSGVWLTAGSVLGAGWHWHTRCVLCPGFLAPLLMKAWVAGPAGHPARARGGAQQGLRPRARQSRGCCGAEGTESQPACRWAVPCVAAWLSSSLWGLWGGNARFLLGGAGGGQCKPGVGGFGCIQFKSWVVLEARESQNHRMVTLCGSFGPTPGRSRVTQSRLHKTLESWERSCAAGGGRDRAGVAGTR